MRVIIFGAGGQLGIDLVRECRKRGHSMLALQRRKLNITDAKAVLDTIERYKPDWVINSAAYNKVDLAESEPEVALRVNSVALKGIAAACQSTGATLLHYSTDHVFSGSKKTPYTERDQALPVSSYGVSKLCGELFVQAYCQKHYVFRVAGVYGPAGRYTNHGNFPELILRKAAERVPLKIVKDFVATPTYSPALAERSIDAMEEKIPYGLYHLGGGDPISWYEFAVKIAEAAGREADISPVTNEEYKTDADRPRYSALANTKLESTGIKAMPSLDECLADYVTLRKRERPRRS